MLKSAPKTPLWGDARAVSPSVGGVLLVALVIIIALVISEFAFGLTDSLQNSDSEAAVSVEETKEGHVIQLTDKQNADMIKVNTTDGTTYTLTSVGDSVTVNTRNPGRFTVMSVNDGEKRVLLSKKTSGNWAFARGGGSDGAATITGTKVVNDYSYLTSNADSGATTLAVNDGSKFSTGDEVLVIQMQDSDGDKAGTFEFRDVASVSGNTVTLTSPLDNEYESGEFTQRSEPIPISNPGTVTQVVRIPHYTDVTIDGGTITAPDWNGRTGGIVFFRASGTVEFVNGGEVDVSGKGFRGGTCGGCGDDWDGGRGEGVNGWHMGGGQKHYPEEVSKNNRNGGGGNHVDNNDGGDPAAGGGHASTGGDANDEQSMYQSMGGEAIGSDSFESMYLGGGGGAGADNDGANPYPENSHGGGIAVITAEKIVDAVVYADGVDGTTHSGSWCSGVSGGGAGGTISLSGSDVSTLDVHADGGASAQKDDPSNSCGAEPSGAGGDGIVRILG